MTYRRFQIMDLFVLIVIAAGLEALNTFAFTAFGTAATFSVSLAAAVGMIAIFRWNYLGLIVAPCGGIACLLTRMAMGGEVDWRMWLSYSVAYLGLAVLLIWFQFLEKERIRKSWPTLLVFVISGCAAIDVVRTLCYLGSEELGAIALNLFSWDLLNWFFAFLILLVASKQANLLVDMKQYLLKVSEVPDSAREREEKKDVNKLESMADSYNEVNDAALLDGGTLSADELKKLQAPYNRSIGKESVFDKENQAKEKYLEEKKNNKKG